MSIAPPFAAAGTRTKFNPNHASDGRFSHGGGGGHAGGEHLSPERVEALKGEVAALGARKGEDWRLEVTGPRTPKEEAGLARAESKGRFLVERKVEPKRETLTAGDRTTHSVGGEPAAETFRDAASDRWVSREHGIGSIPGETRDNPYRSRERAEANSRKWADATAKEETVREYATPKRLEEHFRTERESLIGGGPSAATHTTTFRVIVPQPASKSLRVGKDMSDRGVGGAIPPGDREDAHEDNTFGLPNGTPVAREYRRFLRRIKKEVLGTLPAIGAPVQVLDPDLTDWLNPMETAMTPLLSAYWDEAGKETRARLGLDPDGWRVVDPHLHDAIRDQAHAFCQSTLQTTAETVGDAYRKLNAELIAGLVTEGESIPELAKRVRSVFHGLSREHSVMIARTESSRAVHAASELSAKESGVVSGKVWLLSSNACPLCHRLAEASKANPIPLGGEFANIGSNPIYSSIRMPPGHPHCRCSVTYRLTPEYQALVDANPPETYRPGSLGPEPRAKAKPAEKPNPGPVAESMARTGKYVLEEGPKDARGDSRDVYQLGTFGGLTPDRFDPDAELARIKDVAEHVRKTLTDHPDFVKAIDDRGEDMVERRQTSIGQSHYFTEQHDRMGWGIAGRGGFKMYPAPYTLKDKSALPDYMVNDFRIDAIYVQVHESHHAFGSPTEFDEFSDAVALDYHLKAGNKLATQAVNQALLDKVSWSFRRASGELAESIKKNRKTVAYLYSKHPDELSQVAAEAFGPGIDLPAKIRSWK